MSHVGLGMTHDDETHQHGGRQRGRGPNRAVLVAGAAMVTLLVLGGFFAIRMMTGGGDFTGEGSGRVVVQVTKGESLRGIGVALAGAGVVSSSAAFTDAAAAEPLSSSISPGAYVMRLGMSGSAAVALMLDPASRDVAKVVVPEGLRVSQIVAAAAKATGLSPEALQESLARAGELGLPAEADGSAEGYLFPATYEFPRDVTADNIIKTMIARSAQAAADLDLDARAKDLGLSPREVLTVASLVQGEAAPADYPKVARVIYNRLKQDIKLQLDSTVNFGLGTSDLRLSKEQLASDTPYNTYRVTGLPPSPIGAPGEQAIEAALEPAAGNWIYFVSTDPAAGITKFTGSYAQFLKWKAEFQVSSG